MCWSRLENKIKSENKVTTKLSGNYSGLYGNERNFSFIFSSSRQTADSASSAHYEVGSALFYGVLYHSAAVSSLTHWLISNNLVHG